MAQSQRWACWLGVLWVGVLLGMPDLGVAQGEQTRQVITALPSGQVDWTAGWLQSSGQGETAGRAAHMSEAYTQALGAARQRLFEAVTQLRFDATRIVGQVMQSPAQEQALRSLVETAAVVGTRYEARGRVENTVQLSLFGPLTALLLPEQRVSAPDESMGSDAVYTGLVIDARGLAVQAALFPRILDEEAGVIYAPQVVDAEMATYRGYVGYSTGDPAAQTPPRVGEHPLVVRARRVAGQARVDVVMSRADAARVRQYSGTRRMLRQCRVLIVQ